MRVNGVDLDVVDEGTGIPVVFCHGGSSDRRYWEPQRSEFAKRYRFIAYSQRYRGPGPRPAEGDDSQAAHTGDLIALIERLAAGPVHLVGFSNAVALRAAIRRPDLVRSLTIIEPNLPWLLEGDPDGEAVLAAWRADNARLRSEAAGDARREAVLWFELVNNRGPDTFAAQSAALREMWLDNFGKRAGPAGPPEPIRCPDLALVSAPTLALTAEHGMVYSRRIVERVAACIPASTLVEVPGVTHFMSYQAPETFNRLVLDFLDRN